MPSDRHRAFKLRERFVEKIIDEFESGDFAPGSGRAAMTRKIGEKALVAGFYEAFENRGITINEIALAVKEKKAFAWGVIGSQNETV